MSALCGHLGDFQWTTEVHFEPLVVIVVFCAPGSRVRPALLSTQSPPPRSFVFAAHGRGCDAVVTESAPLQTKRFVTSGHWKDAQEGALGKSGGLDFEY